MPGFSEKGHDDKGDYNIMRCIGIIGAMEVEVASLKEQMKDIQDIIFSKRITLSNSKLSYTIAGEDYSEIK